MARWVGPGEASRRGREVVEAGLLERQNEVCRNVRRIRT